MINWKVRIANEKFWLAFIPSVLLLVEAVARLFGIAVELGEVGNNLLEIVRAVFVTLAILGVVNDPTTEGIHDSALAMTYETPKK